jgi:hypothetical protein
MHRNFFVFYAMNPSAITFLQSLATRTLQALRSRARAIASWQAKASTVSAADYPLRTTAEAPINLPTSSLATAATEPRPVFLPNAASTLILITPLGGGIQAGEVWVGPVTVPFYFFVTVRFSSAMKFSTKK